MTSAPPRHPIVVDADPPAIALAHVRWSLLAVTQGLAVGWAIGAGEWRGIPAPLVIGAAIVYCSHRDVLTRTARLARFRFGRRW